MACISAPTAILASGALSAGTSLTSGLLGSKAATTAAGIQSRSADRAADLLQSRYETTRSDLAPYRDVGEGAINRLGELTGPSGSLVAPIDLTSDWLQKTPGYKFLLDQGNQAVRSQLTASGMGFSGAAIKAGSNYTEGLASTTYQNQFNNELAYRQQVYNLLGGLGTTGENAAAQTGSLGLSAATGAGNYLTSGAAATAGGIVGSTNALTSGLTGTSNAASSTALNYSLLGLLKSSGNSTGGLYGT